MAGFALALLASCAKDPLIVDRNRPPRTFIVAAPVDSSRSGQDASVSYRIHLYWRGEDPDGYVVGYLWAFDDSSITNFHYTTKTDSVFEVTVNDSADIINGTRLALTSKYHTFFIRAVDNLGKPDPNLAVFNRTTYKATTIRPSVQLVGALPSGIGVDTLSDGAPFKVCWTGSDPDGQVILYKYDVGVYSSKGVSDTCAFFNDPSQPGSVGLVSGVYTMTVTAIDNAYATGSTSLAFVVNHDPETWFLPQGNPRGHYIAPFIGSFKVDAVGDFGEGDTVPYRSTVWFDWDGSDVKGGENNVITGYALELRAGTRNGGEPYVIGFLNQLNQGSPPVYFKTNNPQTMHGFGLDNLILDSLDTGRDMFFLAKSKDGSNRPDGTPAAFKFNCNYPPHIDSLWVTPDTVDVSDPSNIKCGSLVQWRSTDYEDGEAIRARVKLDGQRIFSTPPQAGVQSLFIPYTDILGQQEGDTHSVDVWVFDRADIQSPNTLSLTFKINVCNDFCPGPGCTSQSSTTPMGR